ncbi:DUF3343 domain-containing protein [bacterium]|nr:DUF3343 domain-containing protein [bacterium]
MNYAVITFHNSSGAFRAESVLKAAGLECKLIPTPRKLASDCGVALRFDILSTNDVKSVIERENIHIMVLQPMPA